MREPVTYSSYSGFCADYPDPHAFFVQFHSGQDISERIGWSNAEYDRLVDAADHTLDPAKRMALYRQAEDILIEEQPVTFMASGVSRQLQKPWVKGLVRTPIDPFPGIFSLATLRIEP